MFENIIGNKEVKTGLINSVKTNKISHSYLFVGSEGIGKKLIAEEFAKMILCLGKEKYCGICKSCIEFSSNNNPDFMIVEPDGNSIKIEQIRILQKKIQEKPIISNNKVYIINDADKMTKEAQNCLLKTLEEPPKYATIILIGTNENAFLSTIKSRCMIIHFNKLSNEEIKIYLKEQEGIQDISTIMLDMCDGSIGKAINLKDKQEEYQQVENIIQKLDKVDLVDTLKNSEVLYKAKEEIFEILDYINVVLLKKARDNYKYTKCIEIVENTKKHLQQNANYDMSIDNLLFNMWEEIN